MPAIIPITLFLFPCRCRFFFLLHMCLIHSLYLLDLIFQRSALIHHVYGPNNLTEWMSNLITWSLVINTWQWKNHILPSSLLLQLCMSPLQPSTINHPPPLLSALLTLIDVLLIKPPSDSVPPPPPPPPPLWGPPQTKYSSCILLARKIISYQMF